MSKLSGMKKPIREWKYNVFNRVTGECEGVVWAEDSQFACLEMSIANGDSFKNYFAEKLNFTKTLLFSNLFN